MKFLIWMGCLVFLSVCFVLIRRSGYIMGGIPQGLMFVGVCCIASFLCKKIGKKKEGNKDEDDKQ